MSKRAPPLMLYDYSQGRTSVLPCFFGTGCLDTHRFSSFLSYHTHWSRRQIYWMYGKFVIELGISTYCFIKTIQISLNSKQEQHDVANSSLRVICELPWVIVILIMFKFQTSSSFSSRAWLTTGPLIFLGCWPR